ncbi:MAG: prepilin-type N-terminal cleavage/methylation domain-containing protein [Acaryochloris sp. RU_4_1]|nr:prepilin-type N-terminal cleavage/methylation domain-containing protein [Acaryochloris sp. RU_4_1]NJR55894.1 prepilin-type N-terminal cleavage/methylation domain-containing protein [Acaryochloris sp. CRU_2_0]
MSNFKSRYLAYLLHRNSQAGFTLIELLVTIVIIALLSALALPSMLQQSLKARQSATKSHIGAVNRSQQVYRLESKVFANTMTDLGIQIPLSTNDYTYSFGTANATLAEFKATPQNNSLAAYTGCTMTTIVSGNDATTASSIQEQPASGVTPATPPSC